MKRESLKAKACLPSTCGRRGGVEGAAVPHEQTIADNVAEILET